jgi:hypothetical protein
LAAYIREATAAVLAVLHEAARLSRSTRAFLVRAHHTQREGRVPGRSSSQQGGGYRRGARGGGVTHLGGFVTAVAGRTTRLMVRATYRLKTQPLQT